jgi:hypothetical protein
MCFIWFFKISNDCFLKLHYPVCLYNRDAANLVWVSNLILSISEKKFCFHGLTNAENLLIRVIFILERQAAIRLPLGVLVLYTDCDRNNFIAIRKCVHTFFRACTDIYFPCYRFIHSQTFALAKLWLIFSICFAGDLIEDLLTGIHMRTALQTATHWALAA